MAAPWSRPVYLIPFNHCFCRVSRKVASRLFEIFLLPGPGLLCFPSLSPCVLYIFTDFPMGEDPGVFSIPIPFVVFRARSFPLPSPPLYSPFSLLQAREIFSFRHDWVPILLYRRSPVPLRLASTHRVSMVLLTRTNSLLAFFSSSTTTLISTLLVVGEGRPSLLWEYL